MPEFAVDPALPPLSPFDLLHQHLRVVLVEPAGGLNVGAIARVMKNMGLARLMVVNPHCDVLGDEARQMAVHAVDLLETATIVPSIPAALQGCQRVVATSARNRDLAIPVDAPAAGLHWLLAPLWTSGEVGAIAPNPASAIDAAIIFGPEDRGLSNAELIHAQRLVMIPSSPAYASLNLAQAVAICCYEAYRLAGEQDSVSAGQPEERAEKGEAIAPPSLESSPPSPPPPLASVDVLEGFYQQLETVLLDIGYLYPHTAQRRMEKFRLLFNKGQLTPNEVAMLRGILRQMTWATRSPPPLPQPTPPPNGPTP
ncbi:MAG: RNA methyltransferase [Leptolyngbyaceae bacterium]|nr:RNA methyltransferase [Leptolyngbyaceae bacterium]